jgi:hypothetical protein
LLEAKHPDSEDGIEENMQACADFRYVEFILVGIFIELSTLGIMHPSCLDTKQTELKL